MRVIIQRVSSAKLEIEGKTHSSIGKGFLVLLGICNEDIEEDADWLANKIIQMRVFNDVEGKMNLALADVAGQLLVVSQFTLYAETKKGNRPSFISAARPEKAIPLYEHFVSRCESISGQKIQTGMFGADMQISIVNDGPVTIFMDSKKRE